MLTFAPTTGLADIAAAFGISFTTFYIGFAVLVIWSLAWKGFGLWAAARNAHKWWFIAILVVNSLGIVEIIYLLFFRKKKE